MLLKLVSYFSIAGAYVRLNIKSKLEYRVAFASQVLGMTVNDAIWVMFWCFFFNRFTVVRGWTSSDVVTLWAVTVAGYGISDCLFCNAHRLAIILNKGQLDAWLVYPRRVLPHLILEWCGASALGDVIFGFVAFSLFTHPSLPQFSFFTVLVFSTAIAFLGVRIFSGSLTFFLGNAQPLTQQWENALIAFSTYPAGLFYSTE